VFDPPTASVEIRLPRQDAEEPAVGKGFEVELGKFWFNPTTQRWVRWQERHLVVYSTQLATAQTRGLHQRLDQAQTALDQLVAKPGNDLESLNTKVDALLKRHRVQEFFSVSTTTQTVTQTRYVGRGRPAANAPTQQLTQIQLHLQVQRQPQAIEQAEQLAGWRLYLTNASVSRLSLPQAATRTRVSSLQAGSVTRSAHLFSKPRPHRWTDVSTHLGVAGFYLDRVCRSTGLTNRSAIPGRTL
jgi:hypothetical protein